MRTGLRVQNKNLKTNPGGRAPGSKKEGPTLPIQKPKLIRLLYSQPLKASLSPAGYNLNLLIKSYPLGALAHLVERFHGMEEVIGSNPICSTIIFLSLASIVY